MTLNAILTAISSDPGLKSAIPASQIARGVAAAADLNRILSTIIDQTGVNDDHRITPGDMQAISDALWLPKNAQLWREFWLAHGNDNGSAVSGYHWVQDDGATRMFQGRNFVDTVADAIYHFGFQVENGRYANEDGNQNERIADCAGWLNYFLNGHTAVYGGGGADTLGSGVYSDYFAAARNELFVAGAGNDHVWADRGSDTVYGGDGADVVGAGLGGDSIMGEGGRDRLMGEGGDDRLYGGVGDDTLWSGVGNDSLYGGQDNDLMEAETGADWLSGGAGRDTLLGEDGADRLAGDDGNDHMNGGTGNDWMHGGTGADTLYGADGSDRIRGGAGGDTIQLWEERQVADTIVLAPGESGRSAGTIDRIEGFESGIDRIDMTFFGPMRFAQVDFTGGGQASCYYDGSALRIDANGDRALDMIVNFPWVDHLAARDFIFA